MTFELEAEALNAALDALEAALAGLEPAAAPDEVARTLEAPVRAFGAAACEALKSG